jgi:hypothetical protein
MPIPDGLQSVLERLFQRITGRGVCECEIRMQKSQGW